MTENISNPQEIDVKNDILINYLLSNLPSYHLTEEQMEWIHQYFKKSPDSLKQIIESIENILSDGVINLQDIPEIVKCISTIFHERSILMDMTNLTNLILLTRYTLDCMIDTNMIVTNIFEKKTLEFVVNSSLDLLQYHFIESPPQPPSTTTNLPTDKEDVCCPQFVMFFYK
jgi:hypothetical protein